jgi:ribonuclease P/MRP protein subunit RPP1
VDEKTLQSACLSLDCDLISLDLSMRYFFHFQYKMFAAAITRGVHIELCYGPGIIGNADQRRMLIQNASALIRVTRGRGLIISSECKDILACRGPADIVNLAAVWGLGQERGVEAVTTEARKVVVNSSFKRTSYRGVVDVIYGGEKPEKKQAEGKEQDGKANANKRKFVEMNVAVEQANKPLSNRQKKKLAKEAAAAKRSHTSASEQGSELDLAQQ